MKVTKYPQSCFVLDNGHGRVLVDAGTLALDAFSLDDFGELDAVLYTHRHADHFDQRHVDAILDRGVGIHANADVLEVVGADRGTEVRDGQTFEVAGFEVTPHDLPHVELVDGSPGPPNTGYEFDGVLFHPGDGMQIDGVEVDVLAVPIVGPSISYRDAYLFLQQVGASRAIPMHYDMFLADPGLFDHFCDIAEVIVLDHGESTEL
ncbi:MAG: MBL fold metallo-hydrolase [Nitriliruptorales bacterium]|nr:MBL fold metallo-hydrolase [Nitriliruptorales bacterium]